MARIGLGRGITMPRNAVSTLIAVVLANAMFTNDALATKSGTSGRSGMTGSTCATSCHTPAAAAPTVTFGGNNGSTSMVAGTTATFTFTISGGPGVAAGFDVATSGGMLGVAPGSTNTKVKSGEIVQSASTPFSAGSVTYTFNLTAPATPGTVTLYGAGLSGNGNGTDGAGDGTGTTTMAITVTAATTGGGGGTPATTLMANAGGPYSGTVNQAIQFDGSASTAAPNTTIASYSWDFGDGTTGVTGAMPTHTYTTANAYVAKLTVTDNTGASNTANAMVTVTDTAGGGGTTTPAPTGSPRIGQRLYDRYCAECHGPGGLGIPNDGPDITGATVSAIKDAIVNVADMAAEPALQTLESVEIRLISAYLQGAKLYIDNCESCHGVSGSGVDMSGNATSGPAIFGVSPSTIAAEIKDVPEMQIPSLQALTRKDRSLIAFYIPRKTRGSAGALDVDSFSTDFSGTFSDKASDYPDILDNGSSTRSVNQSGALDGLMLSALGLWALRRRRRG